MGLNRRHLPFESRAHPIGTLGARLQVSGPGLPCLVAPQRGAAKSLRLIVAAEYRLGSQRCKDMHAELGPKERIFTWIWNLALTAWVLWSLLGLVRGLDLLSLLVIFALALSSGALLVRRALAAEEGLSQWTAALKTYFMLVLPAWGYFFNAKLSDCAPCGENRPFALPGIDGYFWVYAALLLAYAISRRQYSLRARGEALVVALLIAGSALCWVLALQLSPAAWGLALVMPYELAPAIAPLAVAILLALEAYRRLARAGKSATKRRMPLLAAALILPCVGAFELLQRLLYSQSLVTTLTDTCGWTFSQSSPVPQDCHYLCTVAARGHPRLVRPLRMGVRRGRPIVVNRQLMIANAFEDLLHERWPRFGALCRRLYDAFGLPIARYLRRPLLADLVYLVMKPAEWCFLTTLLLLDRDPEVRLARMYRSEKECD